MIKINQIKLPVTHSDEALKKKIIKNSKMFKKHLLFLFICNIIAT